MIGVRIREVRKDKELTQDDLAKLSGVNGCTISHYETNQRVPHLTNIIKLARALKCDIDYLVTKEVKDSIQ